MLVAQAGRRLGQRSLFRIVVARSAPHQSRIGTGCTLPKSTPQFSIDAEVPCQRVVLLRIRTTKGITASAAGAGDAQQIGRDSRPRGLYESSYDLCMSGSDDDSVLV